MKLINVNKSYNTSYGKLQILKNISVSFEKGKFYAIMGRSGSGKSTLVNILGLLDDFDDGDYYLNDINVKQLNDKTKSRIRGLNIGFVFQSFMLVPTLNALENVQLPSLLRGDSDRQSREQARELLTLLGLGERLHHLPAQLSGGEQQRVALARAFSGRPGLLFADEPTGNLDRKTGDRIADLLFSLNRDFATTLILVTHDEQLAARCDRRLRLRDGKLWEEQ